MFRQFIRLIFLVYSLMCVQSDDWNTEKNVGEMVWVLFMCASHSEWNGHRWIMLLPIVKWKGRTHAHTHTHSPPDYGFGKCNMTDVLIVGIAHWASRLKLDAVYVSLRQHQFYSSLPSIESKWPIDTSMGCTEASENGRKNKQIKSKGPEGEITINIGFTQTRQRAESNVCLEDHHS